MQAVFLVQRNDSCGSKRQPMGCKPQDERDCNRMLELRGRSSKNLRSETIFREAQAACDGLRRGTKAYPLGVGILGQVRKTSPLVVYLLDRRQNKYLTQVPKCIYKIDFEGRESCFSSFLFLETSFCFLLFIGYCIFII